MADESRSEDHDAQEATHPRGDRIQAAPGGRAGLTGHAGGGCDPLHRGHRGRSSSRAGDDITILFGRMPRHYNSVRPHASLGYRPPAPEVFVPAFAACPAVLTRPTPPARHPVAPRPTMN